MARAAKDGEDAKKAPKRDIFLRKAVFIFTPGGKKFM
jgi:hypothetical protein